MRLQSPPVRLVLMIYIIEQPALVPIIRGLALPDNFLVFKNGLRLRIPCEWQDCSLRMNFPSSEDLKQRYLSMVQQAKEASKQYFGKLW